MQPGYLLFRAVVCLSTGVGGDAQLLAHRQHRHVLNQNGIDTRCLQLLQQQTCRFQFVVEYKGVDGHIDLRIELVGILTQLRNVVGRITCRHTSPKALGTDIDGIGTMTDGSHAASQILGRS